MSARVLAESSYTGHIVGTVVCMLPVVGVDERTVDQVTDRGLGKCSIKHTPAQ